MSLHLGLREEEAPLLVERLRESLAYGVAAGGIGAEEGTLEDLLQEADRRMYRNKPKEGP